MRADFIFHFLPACHLTEGRLAALRLLANTATLENDDPSCIYEEVEDWRRTLLEAIDCLANADDRGVCHWNRTDDSLNPLRFPVWITGGLSGGASPGDAYDHFEALGDCPSIMELLLKWAKEDLEGAALNPATRPAP
jgi:hypothetical protein